MNNDEPLLQSPQDANTGKHINFRDLENTSNADSTTSNKEEQSPAKEAWKEMREERLNNDQDPSLGSPQDANTGKHINFLAKNEDETSQLSSSDDEEQSPTKDAWKEMREERMNNDQPI